jgi:hypothetical protein
MWQHRNGTQTIKTRMKLSVMGVKLEYFINHMYHPKLSVLTWTLDYGRLSDLIDSVGARRAERARYGVAWAGRAV